MCEPILVSGLKVIDKNETPVFTDEWAPIPAEDWTGRWDLIDSQGRSVTGRYTVVIETSIGKFRAEVEIVPKGERSYSGRVSMQASVCGFGLSVYRLVEKETAGATIDVQSGEKIMLALPGNPTTGYSWEASEEPSAEILRPLPGEPYRPESSLIGAGGTFLFRYEAVGPGEVTLNFVYHRPWERTPPQNSFSIRIAVH